MKELYTAKPLVAINQLVQIKEQKNLLGIKSVLEAWYFKILKQSSNLLISVSLPFLLSSLSWTRNQTTLFYWFGRDTPEF